MLNIFLQLLIDLATNVLGGLILIAIAYIISKNEENRHWE